MADSKTGSGSSAFASTEMSPGSGMVRYGVGHHIDHADLDAIFSKDEEWQKAKRTREAEEKEVNSLTVLNCPSCGEFWDTKFVYDHVTYEPNGKKSGTPATSPLSTRWNNQTMQFGEEWVMLVCTERHYWWPSENKAYARGDAIANGWAKVNGRRVPNKPAFFKGPTVAEAIVISDVVKAQNSEDAKVNALPVVQCPTCGVRWESHCWDGNRGPLSNRIERDKWTMLSCKNHHYWWPAERKAYSEAEAKANGWMISVPMMFGLENCDTLVPNKHVFMNGPSVSVLAS